MKNKLTFILNILIEYFIYVFSSSLVLPHKTHK